MFRIKTDFGEITVTKSAIAEVVLRAIEEYEHKVFLTNSKGRPLGLASRIGIVNETDYVEVSGEDANVKIKIYVMLRFGTSITEMTELLIENIRSEMVAIIGAEPRLVTVVVTGMISKHIAKRHIKVEG